MYRSLSGALHEEIDEPAGGGWAAPAEGPVRVHRIWENDNPLDRGELKLKPLPSASSVLADAIERVFQEREKILADPNLKPSEKQKLLETSRYLMTVASGRTFREFKSENIVYAILGFSLIVIVILALLTAFSGLPKEVAISFVGTVVGGTIATVAQKLGRL